MGKKKKNIFQKIIMIFFIIFLLIYIVTENGYYEYKMYNKTKLTNEAILKFEEDIKNNKDVSINDYVVEDYIDYTNAFSNLGVKIGNFTEKAIKYIIKKSLKLLSDLFYE